MRSLPSILVAAALLTSAVTCQRLAEYMPGPGFFEHQPPTPLLPGPTPPLVGYPAVPPFPVLPPPAGDSSFDNLTGLHWHTNGLLLGSQPTPAFPPAAPFVPPFPIPPPVLAAIGGGPVTGIAIAPAAGIIYLVGVPGIVVGCAPVPGMPILVPPFLILGAVPPITGLEWDGPTATLYAVNAPGITFNFLIGGGPVLPPAPPPIVLPMPAGDVAIDKTLRLNLFGLRPLYVIAGPMLLDVRELAPIVLPTALPMSQGLAFLDHPAAFPPLGFCACPGLAGPVNFTTGPMAAGNLAFGVGMTGLAPFGVGIFAFDLVFAPGFPVINGVGCGLGLVAPIYTAVALADPVGTAVLPLPLPPGALGFGPLYNQNVTFCPADPLGLVFTPMQSIYVSGL